MKKVVVITIIYCIVIYIFALCMVVFNDTLPRLLPGMALAYRTQKSLLLFCTILPAVIISAFMIGYTTMFSNNEKRPLVRFSAVMMRFFKKIAIAAICGASVVTVTYEVFMPLLRQSITKMEKAPALYTEYLNSARKNLDSGLYAVAHQYAVAAQELFPKSDEAQMLKETCEVFFDKLSMPQDFIDRAVPAIPQETITDYDNAASYELLQRAMVLFQQEEWINAHYYAMLALACAEDGSANETDAKMLAAQAWNELEEIKIFQDPKQESLYRQKMDAYQKLMSKDVVGAYYAFTKLLEENPTDPDAIRYQAIAAAQMAQNYFFFDELPESGLLEADDNICFYATRANGSFYVVYIKGTASVQGTGRMIQYLRDVSVFQYTRNGTYEMSFYVPYAKAVAQPLDSFDQNLQEQLGVTGKNVSVPFLMLESADRTSEAPINRPVYSFAKEEDSVGAEQMPGFLVLPINYNDFLLINDISFNPDDMTLIDLLRFAGRADKYGYAKEVYGQSLCSRVCRPILYLAILIFAAVVGWNYRLLPKNRFRLIWILAIPILTAIIYLFLSIFTYIERLINYGLIELLGMAAVPAIFACSVVVLVSASVLFVSRKS